MPKNDIRPLGTAVLTALAVGSGIAGYAFPAAIAAGFTVLGFCLYIADLTKSIKS